MAMTRAAITTLAGTCHFNVLNVICHVLLNVTRLEFFGKLLKTYVIITFMNESILMKKH